MTVGKPKLGERIKDWVGKALIDGWGFLTPRFFPQMVARADEWNTTFLPIVQHAKRTGYTGDQSSAIIAGVWYVISGHKPEWLQVLADAVATEEGALAQLLEDPSAFLGHQLQSLTSAPATREIAEILGALVMDPVIGLFESYAADPDPDPHEFSRAFHGFMIGLSWAGGIVETPLRAVLGNRAPPIKDMMTSMYWSLGLGFLGWQTLAPLLSSGLQPNLERYYNRLYTPTRFSPGQASDLFALGEWSANEMGEYLRDQGWRDEDIQRWINLSYRTLSEGVLWDLYEEGQLSKPEMDKRLRRAGYDPVDLPLLYKSHEPEEKTEAKRFLISTVKRAFKEGRMGEVEFRAILADQNYLPQIIDLLVAELTTAQAEEERELSEGNIKLLYTQRVIGRDEAAHHLEGLDYPAEVASQLIEAWDRQTLPKAARINKSTILEGFTDGVLGRDEAKVLLIHESGYDADQAELIIKIEEAGRPEPVEEIGVRAASLSMLSDWVKSGLVTRAEIEERAELERFSEEDRERIISLMFEAPPEIVEVTELPTVLLEEAYVFGAITRGDLFGRLLARGMAEEDVELQIRTLELAYPQVFGEFPALLMRHPSVSSVQLAMQRGLIDEAGFRARLEAQGYTLDAIEIFLFNAQYQLPVEPRKPTRGDLTSWLREGVIGRQEFIRRMTEEGYLATDIDLYLQAESPALEDTQIAVLFSGGFLQPGGFVALATEMGYTPEEIEEFLALFTGE